MKSITREFVRAARWARTQLKAVVILTRLWPSLLEVGAYPPPEMAKTRLSSISWPS